MLILRNGQTARRHTIPGMASEQIGELVSWTDDTQSKRRQTLTNHTTRPMLGQELGFPCYLHSYSPFRSDPVLALRAKAPHGRRLSQL